MMLNRLVSRSKGLLTRQLRGFVAAAVSDGDTSLRQGSALDVRLGLTKPLDESSTLRWGVLGAGRVSNDFVLALRSVPGAVVSAVAARSNTSATSFSYKHGIESSYDSYEKLFNDPSVDIVYVGTIHPFHKKLVHAALEANKHVLVEKPMTCNADDTANLYTIAAAKGLFLMEGMWTRFFPAVETIRELMMNDALGEIVAVQADFGFRSFDSEVYPEGAFYNLQLGGGGLQYVGCYPVATAPLVFGDVMPDMIASAGIVDPLTKVDLATGITLKYGNAGLAHLNFSIMGESAEETHIIGTKGRVCIHHPAHCPTAFTLYKHATSRREGKSKVEYHFDLPDHTSTSTNKGGDKDKGKAEDDDAPRPTFNYPNSEGFAYEAAAVQRCILSGLTQCPQYPPTESILVAKVLDTARVQMGMEVLRTD